MTKLDIDNAVSLIARLFPGAVKWTPDRVECLREGMARIQITGEQAAVAVREHRRTTKFNSPTEAELLAAMKRASGETNQTRRMEAPKESSDRLSMLRLVLGMPNDPAADVVARQVVEVAERSDGLRGCRPGWIWRGAVENYSECCGMGERAAMERVEYMIGEAPADWRTNERAKGAK